MKTRWGWLIGSMFSLMLAGVTALIGAEPESPIPFRFAPSLPFVAMETSRETLVETMTMKKIGASHKSVTVTEKRTRVTIEKTDHGYDVTETLMLVDVQEDGKPGEVDEFDQCELRVPVTYHLDAAGKLRAISGIEKIAEKSREIFSPEKQRKLGDMMDAKLLLRSSMSVWQAEYGVLLEKPIFNGQTLTTQSEVFLPDAKLGTCMISLKLGKREMIDQRDGVTLTYTHKYDLKRLARGLAGLLQSDDEEGPQISKVVVTEFSEGGSRFVDLATLLDWRSQEVDHIKVTAEEAQLGPMEITFHSEESSSVKLGEAPKPGVWTASRQ